MLDIAAFHAAQVSIAMHLANVGVTNIGGADNEARRTCREVVALLADDDPRTAYRLSVEQVRRLNRSGTYPKEFCILCGVASILTELARVEIASRKA